MINNILFHPAIPLLIGAFLILHFRGPSRSFILLLSPLISLFFIGQPGFHQHSSLMPQIYDEEITCLLLGGYHMP